MGQGEGGVLHLGSNKGLAGAPGEGTGRWGRMCGSHCGCWEWNLLDSLSQRELINDAALARGAERRAHKLLGWRWQLQERCLLQLLFLAHTFLVSSASFQEAP